MCLSSFFVFLTLHSCDLFAPPPVKIPDGTYEGDYTLTYKDPAGNRTETGQISIVFSKGTNFAVQALSKPEIIPQGQGTFSLKYRQITFADHTERTGAFDTARVVNGDFVYTFDGTNLVMTQEDDTRKIARQMFVFRR
jgi:hypothetical protein